jgi:antitoxin CcdA
MRMKECIMPAGPAAKKPTNLSLSSDLLRQARELDINLSAALDQALGEIVRKRQAELWLEENRAAMEAYNAHVEKQGVFSEGLRGF